MARNVLESACQLRVAKRRSVRQARLGMRSSKVVGERANPPAAAGMKGISTERFHPRQERRKSGFRTAQAAAY
jgi:hypothetical protein